MKIDQELLSDYEVIETDDGSTTLFSKKYNEACHSTSGASNETKLHYIKGCKVVERLQDYQEMNILEVGFGTGLGFLETYSSLREHGKFKFYSFEIDENLVLHFFNNHNYAYKRDGSRYIVEHNDFELIILVGNAREQILKIEERFHAIYQDAFSPKRNSILWTTEWFKELKKISLNNCLMSTYSSSSSIRKSMIEAGWMVTKGEKFGPKRSSTRAMLVGNTDEDILAHLERSPAPMLTDDNYKDYKL